MPEYIYIIKGLGATRALEHIVVERYLVKRETPKRWYVAIRGSETYFTKERGIYTSLDAVKNHLRAEQQRRLAYARRAVTYLEQPGEFTLYPIPCETAPRPKQRLKL